ncbi:hypothetical protein Scep_019104 [Stephania cephalantha]|uniref:Reverse transcriptase n=1 Tax=Stephania cephalantha TaxID=152367 RepID=A0AAP0IAH4_9MAGN
MTQATVIQSILDQFGEASRQKVNRSKTQIFFSVKVPEFLIHNISSFFGFSATLDLGKYLGASLIHRRITKLVYAELLNKLITKLSGWRSSQLSFAGRVTLTKACLQSIPVYLMQSAKLCVSICDEIGKVVRNFIWGSTREGKKMHLLRWDNVC